MAHMKSTEVVKVPQGHDALLASRGLGSATAWEVFASRKTHENFVVIRLKPIVRYSWYHA